MAARSVQDALAWYEKAVRNGTRGYTSKCLGLVANAYGYGWSGVPGERTAINMWRQAPDKRSGDDIPVGALIFYNTGAGRAGHVVTYAGNGKVYTNMSDGRVALRPLREVDSWGQRVGWTPPQFYGHGDSVAPGFSESNTTGPSTGGGKLVDLLRQAGFSGEGLRTAWAVAMRESRGDPNAFNGNQNTGDQSYGLFQINMLGAMGPARRKQFGLKSNDDLLDPLTNAKVAFKLTKGGTDWYHFDINKDGYAGGEHAGAFQEWYKKFGTQSGSAYVGGTDAGAAGYSATAAGSEDWKDGYGWGQAVINSDSELKALFQKARSNKWTGDKFNIELRKTKWYLGHTEAWRQNEALRLTDPTTYKANFNNAQTALRKLAAQMGANPSQETLDKLTRRSMNLGWDAATQAEKLSQYIGFAGKGTDRSLTGAAGQTEDNLRQTAAANGVKVSDGWILNQARSIIAGTSTEDDAIGWIRNQAASAFPAWADEIRNGQNVMDLAGSYMNSMSNLLEIPGESFGLDDPTLRRALQAQTVDGKPSVKPLWQFERDLRKDSRWLKTNNARSTLSDTITGVLGDFGFGGF